MTQKLCQVTENIIKIENYYVREHPHYETFQFFCEKIMNQHKIQIQILIQRGSHHAQKSVWKSGYKFSLFLSRFQHVKICCVYFFINIFYVICVEKRRSDKLVMVVYLYTTFCVERHCRYALLFIISVKKACEYTSILIS